MKQFKRFLKFLIPGFIFFMIFVSVACRETSSSQNAAADSSADSVTVAKRPRTFGEMLENPYAELGLTRIEYKGKLLYDHFCAVCHGKEGDGNGFNAFNLESSFQVKPFNFTDSTAMAALSPETLKKAILEGGAAVGKSPYMPPWGYTLQPDEVNAVIAYIYTFQKKAAP